METAYVAPAPQEVLTGKKQFFLVWSPQGTTPPKQVFATHPGALKVCAAMAKKYPGQDFFLLKAKTVFRAGSERYENLHKASGNKPRKKREPVTTVTEGMYFP